MIHNLNFKPLRKFALCDLALGVLASCSKDEDQLAKPITKKTTYSYSETWAPSSDVDTQIGDFIEDVSSGSAVDLPVEEALFYLEASANKDRAYSFKIFNDLTRVIDSSAIVIPLTQIAGTDYIAAADITSAYEDIDESINIPSNHSFKYFDLSQASLIDGDIVVTTYTVSAEASPFKSSSTGAYDWEGGDERKLSYAQLCNGTNVDETGTELYYNRLVQRKKDNYYRQYYNSHSVIYYRNNVTYQYDHSLMSGFMPVSHDALPGQPNSSASFTSIPGSSGAVYSASCVTQQRYIDMENGSELALNAAKPGGFQLYDWHDVGIDVQYVSSGVSAATGSKLWYELAAYGIPVLQ